MAWIQSHQELRTHPKTLRLARLLDVSPITAIGHLHCLWWWCLDYAQDGNLSDFDCLDIAIGAGWDGDPGIFVDAMDRCGFLDADTSDEDDPIVTVHDWDQYGGRLIEQRQKNAERMRETRAATKNERASHVHSTLPARAGLEKRRIDKSRKEEIREEENVSALPRAKKRNHAFPDDFEPPYEWALNELAMKPEFVDGHVRCMRDWALAKGEARKDWQAFARNWLRKAANESPRASPNGIQPSNYFEAVAKGHRAP